MVICVLLVFIAGCTDSGDNNSYSDNSVSFDYPKTWQLDNSSWSEGFIVMSSAGWIEIKDPENDDIYCIIYSGINSVDTADIIRSGPVNITSEKVVEINGIKGVELIYTAGIKNISTRPSGDFDVSVAKSDILSALVNGGFIISSDDTTERKFVSVVLNKSSTNYVITCSALPEDFDSQKTNFDVIMKSFRA